MATVIGGELLGQVRALLKDGTQTSEFRLVALSVAALGFGAWLEMSGSAISWFWPVSGAIIVSSYALSRGQLKAGAGEAIVEAKAKEAATQQAPTLADRARASGVGLALVLGLFLSACAGAPGMVPDRPDHTVAVSCDAVEPLHRRLELAVVAGDMDDRLDDVERLNDSYRRVCAEGSPVGLEAELLMNEFLRILEGQN